MPEKPDPSPSPPHRAGFVNLIGRPNTGKSTLSNALVGERLSVITAKAQTTRQRILGVVSGPGWQMILSDTPGIVRAPAYRLHETMNRMVSSAFLDADVMLLLTEPGERWEKDDLILKRLRALDIPVIVLVNKVDLSDQATVSAELETWRRRLPAAETMPISALHGAGVRVLFDRLIEGLPEHPPYFPDDTLTDKPERFFAAEIVRGKILLHYKQEVPYSVEVEVDRFEESSSLIRIHATIYANRKSHKALLIGKEGSALKRVGIAARKDMETFFGKQVHLELFVKVREGWRDREADLKRFGYDRE